MIDSKYILDDSSLFIDYYSELPKLILEVKTEEAYYRQVWNRILELYRGQIDSGEFVDAMAGIIEEQLTKAFREALRDNDMDAEMVKEEPYASALEDMILNEFDFVDGLGSDVQAAAEAGTGFEAFQARAQMWSNRYKDAYNQANALIASEEGMNLVWIFGDTDHCSTCQQLNGIVAKASVWDELGVKPQQPPNDVLECGGYRCQCSLEPTDKRQTPKAYDAILNAVSR